MAVIHCTHCGTPLRLLPEQASGRCPRCHRPVEVPLAARLDPSELDFLGPAQAPGELGRLGTYRVLRLLGSGSMGHVFEAEDSLLHRRVALKVMKKAQAKKQENRARFLQEARSAAAIEHDHIVTIYQVGEDRDMPFLAMKLLLGESLEDRVERIGPLPAEEVVRIGQEIAQGLSAAHERGLIHRDIKPANIWLEEGKGRVKIVDFGLARACEDEAADEAERNYLIGTPLYMSPEQARGGEVDPRTDLFSLGAVLYKISTGEQPFKGRSAKAVLLSVVNDDPEPPRKVRPSVPPVLSRLIMDLLEKKPDDRYRSAEVVVSQLEEARGRLHEATPEEAEEVVEAEEAEPAGAEKRRKAKRKPLPKRKAKEVPTLERKVIGWAIFAGVCVALLLGYLVVRNVFFKKKEDAQRHSPSPRSHASQQSHKSTRA